MIDIKILRESPDKIRQDLKKRGDKQKISWVDELLEKDERFRRIKSELDELGFMKNQLDDSIQKAKKEGKPIKPFIEKAKGLPQKRREKQARLSQLEGEIKNKLMRLPNTLAEDVPEGVDDTENVEVRVWGKTKKPGFDLKHHGQLAENLGLADFERAVKIAGSGFYFMLGDLVLLDLALQRLAIDLLSEKDYTPVSPPYMMRGKPYEGVTDLADFEDVMYKIDQQDEYLIATSEHPLAAMHSNELFDEKDLPIKYCGISPCFRKEIGKHGIDERGFFRVHQFNKIEQFIFCGQEDSNKYHDELIDNVEKYMQKIDLPYRVVNVCTGDIGTVASKKYDLEGYSPREDKYIELASCSNCTSYQSVRLNIRVRGEKGNKYVHTLNSTEVATSRTIRLILENYQNADGEVRIPAVLREYVGGKDKLAPI